jgi:surface antigen
MKSALAAIALFGAMLTALPAIGSTYLQCVTYARAASGIDIRGNARDWWAAAEGQYERGQTPRVGAVMHFAGTSAMPAGHVAVVAAIVSDRELLIDHANWSPINGRRGQIERGVRAVDVSTNGDWSSVRVWYAPIHDLGLRANPVSGFIYPSASRDRTTQMAAATPDASGDLAAIVDSLGR